MNPSSTPPSPEQILMQIAFGKFLSRSLTAVADLGVADHLKDGPRTAEKLAELTHTNADAMYRVMRALAAAGVFAEQPGRSFALTPVGDRLRSDVPGSQRGMARWLNESSVWAAWGRLDYSLETGKPAFDHVHGSGVFAFAEKNPAFGTTFNNAMTSFSRMVGDAVGAAYDLSGVKKLVDVGGGHGALLCALLGKNPSLRGVLFDLPQVVAGAGPTLGTHKDRIEVLGGDFFKGVPKGGDAYIMKAIIHDWSDDQGAKILTNCREAMAPGAKVLLVESVVSDLSEAMFSKLLDLEMLVMTDGGRERTQAEFAALFAKSGLKLARIVPTQGPVAVIEAVAA